MVCFLYSQDINLFLYKEIPNPVKLQDISYVFDVKTGELPGETFRHSHLEPTATCGADKHTKSFSRVCLVT